jgi:hypothetical protein
MNKRTLAELKKEIDTWKIVDNYHQRPAYKLLREELSKLGYWKQLPRNNGRHLREYRFSNKPQTTDRTSEVVYDEYDQSKWL